MYASFYDKVPCNLIHELSVAVLFPTSALSESHCFTVDGGGTGFGGWIELSHSTFLHNMVIRWLFKISLFITWCSCIVGVRHRLTSTNTIFLKYRRIYIACESAADFTKPGMTTPTSSLPRSAFLYWEVANCCTYPSVPSQTRHGKLMNLKLWSLTSL